MYIDNIEDFWLEFAVLISNDKFRKKIFISYIYRLYKILR